MTSMRSTTPSGITPVECKPSRPSTEQPNDSEGRTRCRGCGQPFRPTQANQLRCKPNCRRARSRPAGNHDKRSQAEKHKARTALREADREFICIDGEGVTDPDTGEHHYVLISCGDKHFSYDGAALEFGEIMHFLWSCYVARKQATFVGFYLKYDWAQWLRSIPLERARALLDEKQVKKRVRKGAHLPPFPVTYGGWDFDYLYGRRFKLRPTWKQRWFGADMLRHREKCNGCDGCRGPQWMWINDAGSYFQTSLLKAINPKDNPNPVCTLEEFKIIEEGKRRRQSAEYDPAMIEYNQLECEITSRLMAQLAQGMREEGLRPARDQWYGPGQLAQLWLRKIKAPTGAEVREAVPEAVRLAARGAYFGGWFEIFWHGRIKGTSYGYDINSAYPWIMSQLPCLLHGTWRHHSAETLQHIDHAALLDGVQLIHATVKGSDSVCGAMLHRKADRTIVRPHTTKGWFWANELKAALDAKLIDQVTFHERWHYAPCGCKPPLAEIAALYEGRIAIGKNSPAGKARKLIYNSCAGKFQQSVGEPVFGNPLYASMITAGCRAMICQAIGSHPGGADALLMVATDGVAFRATHPGLVLHDTQLGAWTLTEHKNLTLYMPGVYWDDATRARVAAGELGVFKSRGVAARDLSAHLGALDTAWEPFRGWPEMTLPVSFQLISPKQALEWGDWSLCGQVRTNGERTISADPKAKRWALGPGRSKPYGKGKSLESLPYDGSFGDELRVMGDAQDGDHPDGPVANLRAEVLYDR